LVVDVYAELLHGGFGSGLKQGCLLLKVFRLSVSAVFANKLPFSFFVRIKEINMGLLAKTNMWVGRFAFIVLLILGGITGVVVFTVFFKVAPVPGVMDSLYRKNLTPQDIASANPSTGGAGTTAASSSPLGASVTILAGAFTQGNPAYSPDTVAVKKGESVGVSNKDSVPHTITNGKDPSDPTSGKLFDTSIISPAASAQFATTKLAAGNYPFHCSIHPYMTGTLKVQ
jgi:plastocyanin